MGPRALLKKQRQYEQALAEAKDAEAKKEKIKNTVLYESVNSATYSVNDTNILRLSNPAKSAKLFGGEVRV